MKLTVLLICFAAVVAILAISESKSDEQRKDAASRKSDASDKFIGKEAGQVRDDNGLKMKLVWCPPGKFTMGYGYVPYTRVEVTFTHGVWLGKHEVTQEEYQRIMGQNPSYFSAQGKGQKDVADQDTARFPVDQVSWDDAVEFCRRLTDHEHQAKRLPSEWEYTLPTEAQWQYACQAGTTTKYSFGDKLSAREANVAGDPGWAMGFGGPDGVKLAPTTTTVGSYSANRWGLCDMHGNAWEWCRDWYASTLPGGMDPEVKSEGQTRVFRGGGFMCNAYGCDSEFRRAYLPAQRYRFLGFRVALRPSETK